MLSFVQDPTDWSDFDIDGAHFEHELDLKKVNMWHRPSDDDGYLV